MAWQGSSPNRTRGAVWAKIRKAVLVEEPVCRQCVKYGYTDPNPSTICDHITPLAEGGKDDRLNLQGLCGTCHNEKTLAESARSQGRREPQPKAKIGNDGWPVVRKT